MYCRAGWKIFEMWPLWFAFFSIVLALNIPDSVGINCYTCSSSNGSTPSCEDPIDTSLTTYTEKCMVPKKGHVGLFPANFCIKIVGKNKMTYEKLVIRSCATKTMDSQCGVFRYQEDEMSGCILTCDYNGCNPADTLSPNPFIAFLVPVVYLIALVSCAAH